MPIRDRCLMSSLRRDSTEPRYPILVERLEGPDALRIACQTCDWETVIKPEDIQNERNYMCARCGGWADYKYEEADFKCPNCGKLGFTKVDADGSCSRRCALQWEWAKTLKERAA